MYKDLMIWERNKGVTGHACHVISLKGPGQSHMAAAGTGLKSRSSRQDAAAPGARF